MEDGVGQVLAGAALGLGQAVAATERHPAAAEAEDLDDVGQHVLRRGLVERQRHGVAVDAAQVDAPLPGPLADLGGLAGDVHGERVEPRVVPEVEPGLAQAGGQIGGEGAHPRGDRPQPVGPVVHGVHRGHDGQQHLGGADVGRGLLAADVLLSGLQCQPVGGAAGGVDRDPDEPPGQGPAELVAGGEEPGVRSAEAHRHAEALGRPDRGVGAQLARRDQQRAGQQVGGHDGQPAGLVHRVDDRPEVADDARGPGVLQQHGVGVGGGQVGGRVAHHHVEAQWLGPGCHHGDRLWVALGVDEEDVARVAGRAPGQSHGLGGGGALVEHRGVRDLHPGEIAHHRLEVEQRLEPALADLGLVRRVGRVPGRVLEDVAEDDARRVGAVVALPDQRGEDLVAVGQRPQAGDGLGLGQGTLDLERLVDADGSRDGLVEEVVERGHLEGAEHAVDVFGRRTDVAVGELLGAGPLPHVRAPGVSRGVATARPAGGAAPSVTVTGSRAASPLWSFVPERFRGVAPSAPGPGWCPPRHRDSPTEVVSPIRLARGPTPAEDDEGHVRPVPAGARAARARRSTRAARWARSSSGSSTVKSSPISCR